MSKDFLKEIIAYKKQLLKEKKSFFATLKDKAKDERLSRYRIFKEAISRPGGVNLIAEIKKASPSKGIICKNFDVLKLAGIYQKNGVAAISVLIEDKYFLGKLSYICTVSNHCQLPTLAKDFIIDDVQIYEAFYHGASAVLLIVAILDDAMLKHLLEVASNLDLDCLVEVHNEQELERALKAKAEIIGINNRDLHTFQVDFNTCRCLAPMIPKDKIIVAESGISAHEEIVTLRELGVHAVLIGETFLKSPDIAQAIKDVMYGQG